MPPRNWTLTLISQTLDDEMLAVEPLLFPELFCCDFKAPRLKTTIARLAGKVLEMEQAVDLHRRVLPDKARAEEVRLTLKPPTRHISWVDPVMMRFDVIRWRHHRDASIAMVPALGIEVITRTEADMPKLLVEQIIASLRRSGATESLFKLALTQRITDLELTSQTISVNFKSARQRAKADETSEQGQGKPVIEKVGHVIGTQPLPKSYENIEAVEQLAGVLTARVPRSVLLIGPSGSGKTTLIGEMSLRRKALVLSDIPLWATSGARLVAGMTGFGMWQQRCQQLCTEAARDHAILHVGSLVELMQVGRIGGSGGIAGFFRPYLNRGDLLMIAECTPEQLPIIERLDPHLLELFHQQRVEEPDSATGRKILLGIARETKPAAQSESPWLATLDRLHRRYATYSAYPGRPARFLQNLLKDLPDGRTPTVGDVIDAFARETGLPRFMLDAEIPLELDAARAWFTGRLIGQTRAVDLVVDLLATVKTALSRPRRPIASLLFVGPTGVGKTEMAKALAEYFFADRARLTRFDMSEFASPAAVDRLIGGALSTDGLLTSKVRQQPFSVILFDEFEKAHPAFFDLLLQVLGEGRLTDTAGRVGDFSNTIVVMTSNLGAESFGRGTFGLNPGAGDGYAHSEQHFTDEVRGFLRPELFNRIDRIVPFIPLDSAMIGSIAERELKLVQERDGIRLRGVNLQLDPAAIAHLVKTGYDVRYGARPLKRAIERELLAPLAAGVNNYMHTVPLIASALARDGTLAVDVHAETERPTTGISSSDALSRVADECSALRRDVQRCQACSKVLEVTNQLYRLQREQERIDARRKAKEKPSYDAARSQRIKELRVITDELDEIVVTIQEMEDAAQSAFYSGAVTTPVDGGAVASPVDGAALRALQLRFHELLLLLLSMRNSRSHGAVLGILGKNEFTLELTSAYLAVARSFAYSVQACWYSVHSRDKFIRHGISDLDKYLAHPDPSAAAIGLWISGNYAGLRFDPEAGVHGFEQQSRSVVCLVESSESPLLQYIPKAVKEWPTEPSGSARRIYRMDTGIVEDALVNGLLTITGRDVKPTIAEAIELQLRSAAEGVLES